MAPRPDVQFLLDQNVPVTLLGPLRLAGHEANHTRDLGLSRAADLKVLRRAREEGEIVLTFDSDFSRLLALQGSTAPSVILLRLGPAHLADLERRVLQAIAEARPVLEKGAVVVIDSNGVRARSLPLA